MIAVKLGSPLLLAYNDTSSHEGKREYYFSSDKQALSGYADKLIYLDDGDIVHLKENEYQIKSNGIPTDKKIEDMDIATLEASKGEYKHFMLKEIFEQANIIRRIFK